MILKMLQRNVKRILLQHFRMNNKILSMPMLRSIKLDEPFCKLPDGFSLLLCFGLYIYYNYLCGILKIIHYSIASFFICNLPEVSLCSKINYFQFFILVLLVPSVTFCLKGNLTTLTALM